MRYLWPLVLSPLIGCSPSTPPSTGRDAVANLRAQATAVEQAMIHENHQQMADLTHPALINYFGGRDGYIKELETAAADLRHQGLKFHGFRFGSPSQLVESAGELYAIYPYALELTGPDGKPASQPSYLICVSRDDGATWKFLDGAGVRSDPSKLQRVLPHFPAELALPEPGPLIVHP